MGRMGDRLTEYRRKRDAGRTPEPVPAAVHPGRGNTFVIQQHHARSLHWDLRLERDGVLVSWAVPRGIPRDPERNHLAVQTEDHPMEYATFSGEIPAGEYGGGSMTIYDSGTYTTEKWRDREVMIVLSGARVSGRYVLFRTDGKNWMIHRMDPPPDGWTPMPERVEPMRPAAGRRLPPDDGAWAYELAWNGIRAAAYVSGGRLRLLAADGREITAGYPELRAMAERLAPTECVLDGELVAFDRGGRISREALDERVARLARNADSATVRRQAARTPVQYLAYDLLWLDGVPTPDLPYRDRRDLLDGLGLAGANWQTPPYFGPGGGAVAKQTSAEQGLAGVVAKRLDAPYAPGEQAKAWRWVA
jgi:bifunctional non-homologous end joining protein LigD